MPSNAGAIAATAKRVGADRPEMKEAVYLYSHQQQSALRMSHHPPGTSASPLGHARTTGTAWCPRSRVPLARRPLVGNGVLRSMRLRAMRCRTFSPSTHKTRGRKVGRKEAAWTILTRYSEVAALVDATTRAADSDKESLGFFPAPVFEEFARKDQLFVAVAHVGERREYAGHLLFNARYPTAHVRQIFVLERHRDQGLGTLLLDALKKHLTELQFISIRARSRGSTRSQWVLGRAVLLHPALGPQWLGSKEADPRAQSRARDTPAIRFQRDQPGQPFRPAVCVPQRDSALSARSERPLRSRKTQASP